MIDLKISQSWLEKSSDESMEEFKSTMLGILNSSLEDRFAEKRWSITKILEDNTAQLFYDERVLATLKTEGGSLFLKSESDEIPREDTILYAARFSANLLFFTVYSNFHNGALLPIDFNLVLDHSFFHRSKPVGDFFSRSQFIPRYGRNVTRTTNNNDIQVTSIAPPFYAESKVDGSIHIINYDMLDFLISKDNQEINEEFSYKVANSMTDFAKKYNFGLVPIDFYQNFDTTPKIINYTYFDIFHITRKVFIDPYVWDFDTDHEARYYDNVKNGLHLMDKVREGENLDSALRRVLREELKVGDDYIGAKVWGLEFDRDKAGLLTPRLKINVFVHGLLEKHRSEDHDWVSIR